MQHSPSMKPGSIECFKPLFYVDSSSRRQHLRTARVSLPINA
jgi:hypothetical protein